MTPPREGHRASTFVRHTGTMTVSCIASPVRSHSRLRSTLGAVALALSNAACLAAPLTTLERAEKLLAAGRAAEAAHVFEQVARRGEEHHSGEETSAEIGVVRSHWQAGEVRKALAYAHLVSGEHPESMEALAWVALIEDRVGQADAAMARLKQALLQRPDDRHLQRAIASLQGDRGSADVAPRFAVGLVIDAGRRVLVPWHSAEVPEGLCMLRASDGRARRAVVEAMDADAGIAVMRLLQSMSLPDAGLATARFTPGRPAFMLVPVAGESGRPRLVPGLLTSGVDAEHARFASRQQVMAASVLVFDDAARLVAYGSDAKGADLTLSTMARAQRAAVRGGSVQSPTAAPQKLSSEELYERLLPRLVQVGACGRTD